MAHATAGPSRFASKHMDGDTSNDTDSIASSATERDHHDRSSVSYDTDASYTHSSIDPETSSTSPSLRPFSPRHDLATHPLNHHLHSNGNPSSSALDRTKADRAVTLIADLTEELELVRHLCRKDLRAREAEIRALECMLEARKEEVKRGMDLVEEVLSLRGYVVRLQTDPPKRTKVRASCSRSPARADTSSPDMADRAGPSEEVPQSFPLGSRRRSIGVPAPASRDPTRSRICRRPLH